MSHDARIRSPTELRRGDYLKVYVVDVHKSTRGPVIKISRTHRNLLRRLMEQEIPEVRDGKSRSSRLRASRAIAARWLSLPQCRVWMPWAVVSVCAVCASRTRQRTLRRKIDVVEWNETVGSTSRTLSPAKVQAVLLDDDSAIKTATVVVPDRQLSLAIGKEGRMPVSPPS